LFFHGFLVSDGDDECRSDVIFSRTCQGEEPLNTGGVRVFSLDASFGLLANSRTSLAPVTRSASASRTASVSCAKK